MEIVPPQVIAYMCRHCRWHGLDPKRHIFGGGNVLFTHIICPNCNALIRQYDNLEKVREKLKAVNNNVKNHV